MQLLSPICMAGVGKDGHQPRRCRIVQLPGHCKDSEVGMHFGRYAYKKRDMAFYFEECSVHQEFSRFVFSLNRALLTRNNLASVEHFHKHHFSSLPPFTPALCRDFRPYKPSPAAVLHICQVQLLSLNSRLWQSQWTVAHA